MGLTDPCFQNSTLIFTEKNLPRLGVILDDGFLLVILDTKNLGTIRTGTSVAMI